MDSKTEYIIKLLTTDLSPSQRLKLYKELARIDGILAKSEARGVDRGYSRAGINDIKALFSPEKELVGSRRRALGGRCANGAERDAGQVVHAVNGWAALCGAKPGRSSAGWVEPWPSDSDVNCPRCARHIEKLEALRSE